MKTVLVTRWLSGPVLVALSGLLFSGASAAALGTCPEPPSGEVNQLGYGLMLGLAYSPDGIHVAAASTAGVVIWDVESGTAERFLQSPRQDPVHSVAWSPDGRWLAGGGSFADGTIYIWSAGDGDLVHTLTGHTSYVFSVAWSPDGTRLAGVADRSVRVWSVEEELLLWLGRHDDFTYAVNWSPDGTQVASGGADAMRIWSAEDGRELRTFSSEPGTVSSIAWSPDGTRLAEVTSFGFLLVRAADNFRVLLTIRGGSHALAWSPDSTMLAGTDRGSIVLWAAEDGRIVRTLSTETRLDFTLTWSPDGAQLVSGSYEDQELRVWSVDDGTVIRSMLGHTSAVTSLAWSPDGTQLVTASDSGVLRLWRPDESRIALAVRQDLRSMSSVVWSPDGTQFADAAGFYSTPECVECTVRVWSSGGELLRTLEVSGPIHSIAYSPDGSRLAGVSGVPTVNGCVDCALRIWSAKDGQLLRTIEDPDAPTAVAWSPDGTRVATGSDQVRIWTADDGQLLMTLRPTISGAVRSLAFSPDGDRLAAADVAAHIWSVDDGRLLHVIRPSTFEYVDSLAWSADSTLLATGNTGSVTVFSTEDGSLVQRLAQRIATAYPALAWQPGGGCYFATGNVLGVVQLWGPSP